MKKAKKVIKSQEARMLQILYKVPRSLTINELSQKSNISWITTDTYLKKWKEKGLVMPIDKEVYSQKLGKNIKREEWEINRELVNKIIKRLMIQKGPEYIDRFIPKFNIGENKQ